MDKQYLMLDDVEAVGDLISRRLTESGYPTEAVTTPGALLNAIADRDYRIVFLDLELRTGTSIRETRHLIQELFPEVILPHEAVLDELNEAEDAEVTGNYLLPMIKAVKPATQVIILTGVGLGMAETHYLRKWQAYDTVQKLSEDPEFTESSDNVIGLVEELLGLLSELYPGEDKPPGIDPPDTKQLEPTPLLTNFESDLAGNSRGYSLIDFLNSHIGRWPETYDVRGEILYFNQSQELLEQIAQVGFLDTKSSMRLRQIEGEDDFKGGGVCAYAVFARESVFIPKVRFDTRYKPVRAEDRTQCELAIPLQLGSEVIGVLNLEADEERAFDYRHLEYFENLSPILAQMIEHETFRIEERFLGASLQEISQLTDPEDILHRTLDQVLGLVDSRSAGCVLVPVAGSRDEQELRVVTSRGLTIQRGDTCKLSSFGVIKRALKSPDRHCYWSLGDQHVDYVQLAEGINSEYAIVMEAGNEVIALLDIESQDIAISERYQRAIGRLTANVAMLVAGLREKGKSARNEAVDEALVAVRQQMHIANGTFGVLVDEIRSMPDEHSLHLFPLCRVIKTQLTEAQRRMASFLKPSDYLPLDRILTEAGDYAANLRVLLTNTEIPGIEVRGTDVGFRWLFGNLILNTKKHTSPHLKPKAWISTRIENGYCVLEYWDNGESPDLADGILTSSLAGQGMKDVQNLCNRYRWEVATKCHTDGGLQYIFRFEYRMGT